MRAGQSLSSDRNSKDVEIVSEIYLQPVQVASPTVTDYRGLSGKLRTAERHCGQGKPDFDAVTLPLKSRSILS